MQPDELRALRKSIKLTIAEMAEAIGISARHLGDMERGGAAIEKRTELAVRYVVEHHQGE